MVAVRSLANAHNVERLRVFGSRAKGTSGPSSDVDLLVRFKGKSTLIQVIGFQQDVADLLGLHVDVVEEGGLSPHLGQKILSEAVLL